MLTQALQKCTLVEAEKDRIKGWIGSLVSKFDCNDACSDSSSFYNDDMM